MLCPACFTPRKEIWYPFYRRLGGPHGQSRWIQKISPPTGIRSLDRPACSELLYQLQYPGPCTILVPFLNLKPSKNILTIHSKQQKCVPYFSTSHWFFHKWISGWAPVLLLRAEFKFICNYANYGLKQCWFHNGTVEAEVSNILFGAKSSTLLH
jgi:hypothetical protein